MTNAVIKTAPTSRVARPSCKMVTLEICPNANKLKLTCIVTGKDCTPARTNSDKAQVAFVDPACTRWHPAQQHLRPHIEANELNKIVKSKTCSKLDDGWIKMQPRRERLRQLAPSTAAQTAGPEESSAATHNKNTATPPG